MDVKTSSVRFQEEEMNNMVPEQMFAARLAQDSPLARAATMIDNF